MNFIPKNLVFQVALLGVFGFRMIANPVEAQVHSVGAQGFEVRVAKTSAKSSIETSQAFVKNIGKWWSGDHTWSGKAANLSLDLERCVLIEELGDGGFCRHMELAHYEPGKLIRLTGGLGPLKEMGLDGTLTIRFTEKEGQTLIEAKYAVHGYSPNGFEALSSMVHQVLDLQFERLKNFSETGNPDPSTKE
jgi:hypothetical protein